MNRKLISDLLLTIIAFLLLPGLSAFAAEPCSPPEGIDQAISHDNLKYLIFGELHGTVEAPSLFAESICAAVTSGKKVLVGLEFPESNTNAFQDYIVSDGNEADVQQFLSDTSWTERASQFPDGRTSHAMLDMMDRIRTLRADGHEVSITGFVRPVVRNQGESQTPYEQGLASSLMESASGGDYDLVMVLVGNLHAIRSEVQTTPPFEPMAMHLPEEETLSLKLEYSSGSAWNCRPECGEYPVRQLPEAEMSDRGIVLGIELAAGYDGIFNVGTISASPPVTDAQHQ